ncbi:MAG: chemotaxis-specific protein-glutamate methyltransferase CheB [Geobacter sp.]|nr:chemotaxis-specific protein-glutamate methyltransferase CheB [Geobacter sp.]
MIKILLADDSLLVRSILKDLFSSANDIEVIGEARNGREAVDMTGSLRPDLVIMDIMMPVLDGLAAIEEIMASCPTPILVLSGALDNREVNQAFEAIKKGALDVMEKPVDMFGLDLPEVRERILNKVRMLSRIRVIGHRHRRAMEPKTELASQGTERTMLVIGASTGGPKAVLSILKTLPPDFKGSVFVVQHISNGFAAGFAGWLNRESRIKVRLAEEGDVPRPGEVLVAPNHRHIVLQDGKIALLDGEPVNSCRPSIDVFFKSFSLESCRHVVAVLLTGMGRDGAEGLNEIHRMGGLSIAQNEQSSVVFGMPRAAIALGGVDHVLSLDEIPGAINKLFSR